MTAPIDVCNYILDNSRRILTSAEYNAYRSTEPQKQTWIKCIEVLRDTIVRRLPLRPTELFDRLERLAENFNIEDHLTQSDYLNIWKWMLNDYNYEGEYYRSRLLELYYFKNHRIQDDPGEFLRYAPTNFRRTVRYWSGISHIGRKEKEIINTALISFFYWALGIINDYSHTYGHELKPLRSLYNTGRIMLEIDIEQRNHITNMYREVPPTTLEPTATSGPIQNEPPSQRGPLGGKNIKTKMSRKKKNKLRKRMTIKRKY